MKLESQHTHWPAATPKHHLHRWTYTLCLGRLLGGHSAGYFTELSLTGMATQALSGSVKLDLGFTCPTQQHIPKDHQALRIHPQVPICHQPILRRLTLLPLPHWVLRFREHPYSWYWMADWTGVGTLPMTLCGHLVLVGPAVLSPLLSVEG